MKMRGRLQKILGLIIAGSLLALIFTVLLPPTMAINLDTGEYTPEKTFGLNEEVTFQTVTITLQGIEFIPLTELKFTINCSDSNQEIYNVTFDVPGNEISDSCDCFTITISPETANMLSTWYRIDTGYEDPGGQLWGINPGYGYGYGDALESSINLTYQIVFTTKSTGTFYGRLFATATLNSHTEIYYSDPSETFTVGQAVGGRGARIPPPLALVCSQETLAEISKALGIPLDTPFYAKDTNGDNLVDEFTDPNGILIPIRSIRDGAKILFLLSSDGDNKPDLLWNSADDTFLIITNITGTIVETQINTAEETITVLVNVDKDGWIYIEVPDQYEDYPEYTIEVQTASGREIDPEYVWRENGKVYFLDDPAIQYQIIYTYDILDPIFSPADGAEFENEIPQISITYYEEVSVVSATLNGQDIRTMLSSIDLKTYTFKPTTTIGSGVYELTVTVEDDDSNTRTSTATYIVNLPYSYTTEEFPWTLIIILAIILIIAAIIVILKLFVFY